MLLSLAIFVFSCDNDDDNNDNGGNNIVAPTSYDFTRDGVSSVSFSGQTTRLNQVDAILKITLF